jgi:hypothetical protein
MGSDNGVDVMLLDSLEIGTGVLSSCYCGLFCVGMDGPCPTKCADTLLGTNSVL